MKRVWTAAVLLALVITGCLYNSYAVSRTAARISAPLTQAMCCDSPTRAQAHLTAAQAQYDRQERYLRAVMNRQRLDTVRAGFARSQAAARLGDAAQLQLSLAELREAVLALR